jgi:hypothetical protein
MQNGFVESFNGRMRDELLNETMFRNLAHARAVIAAGSVKDLSHFGFHATTAPWF